MGRGCPPFYGTEKQALEKMIKNAKLKIAKTNDELEIAQQQEIIKECELKISQQGE